MPLKIGNYGNWEGDRPGQRPGGGYHPPACTCYTCNEGHSRRAARGSTGRTPPRPSGNPRTPPVRPRPTTQTGGSQHRRPRASYPAAKRSKKGSGLWFWWCLTLAVVIYVIVAGVDALDTYRTTPSDEMASLSVILAESASAPFRYIEKWVTVTSSVDTDAASAPTTLVAPDPPLVLAPLPTEAFDSASSQPSSRASIAPPTIAPPTRQAPLPEPTEEALEVVTPPRSATPTPLPAPTATSVPDQTITLLPTPTITPTSTLRPTSAPRPTPTPLPWTVPLDVAMIEQWIVIFTNEARESHGKRPLEHDPRISDIARYHSENMVAQDEFSHDLGGKDPTDRALSAGYDCKAQLGGGSYTYGLAENIAKNHRVKGWSGMSRGYGWVWTPQAYDLDERGAARSLVEQWLGSPGHRANILNGQYRRIGVGVAIGWGESARGNRSEVFWATQNFSSCR